MDRDGAPGETARTEKEYRPQAYGLLGGFGASMELTRNLEKFGFLTMFRKTKIVVRRDKPAESRG
jgi:hypothetical protein